MIDSTLEHAPRELTTSSWMKQWYMVQFKGYTIVQRREVPKVTRLGRLTYESLWQLRSPSGENATPPEGERAGIKS